MQHSPQAPSPCHWRSPLTLLLALTLVACSVVPDDDQLLMPLRDGGAATLAQPCGQPRQAVAPGAAPSTPVALDARQLRVVSWNIHKGVDVGWQADLTRYANESDLLLLQEAVLSAPMRSVIERAGHDWRMTGAFSVKDVPRGVLVAARASPVDSCVLREFEPLFKLPKSALVTRYPLAGTSKTLAVSNLHGINFTVLFLGSFRSQLEAVAKELQGHDGPIVFAGDFNTWTAERHTILESVANQLGLSAVSVNPDGRRRTLGRPLDHLYVRGFTVVSAKAPEVKSSDHNPILVTLAAKP
ncbi:MAG: hypothetical protein RJA10_3579 [Pseudomonadota bacterium]